MIATERPVEGSQAAFNERTLRYYDWLLAFTCNRIWRCSIDRTLDLYQRHVTSNHLEVGVGTGYFLDRIRFPGPEQRLALLDPNPHCLRHTSARLARYSPEAYRASALEPIKLGVRGFDSLAINYVLHCMPGALPEKGVAFVNLRPLLNPGGVLFGSTVLRVGVPCDLRARVFMRLYNARKVFCNLQDSLDGLRKALEGSFNHIQLDVIGCVAQFCGTA
ncbi:MAG TPA: class I SAM-dependent methyltransferase [Steroidobacteraceae bacterium]|nr:class I SAM-dependent methyltransferase [Steroidobacteraceae bacterium]